MALARGYAMARHPLALVLNINTRHNYEASLPKAPKEEGETRNIKRQNKTFTITNVQI